LDTTVEKVLVVFVLMGIGYLVRRRGLVGKEGLANLISLNIDFLMPSLVFVTTAQRLSSEAQATEGGLAALLVGFPLLGVALCLTGSLLGALFCRLSGLPAKSQKTFIYVMTFANSSFISVPLLFTLKGQSGVLHIFLYNIGYLTLQWTYGMWLLQGKPQPKYLLHPVMISLALGAVVGLSGLTLPAPLMESLKMLGDSSVPFALLCVGGILVEEGLHLNRHGRALSMVVGLRLLAMPLLAFMTVRLGWLREPFGFQAVLQASMPVMAQAAIYTARFGGDVQFAGAASFLTTVLCIVTVPFFLGLVK